MADFASWSQNNLVSIAHELNKENVRLKEDIKILRDAWRELVKERYLAGVLVASPIPLSPSPAQAQEPARLYDDRR